MATAKTAARRVVHVALPGGEADNDLKKIFRATEQILGRLGCGGCHSGFDLRWVGDPFIINAKGDLAGGGGQLG